MFGVCSLISVKKSNEIIEGIIAGVPIIIGYLPIAITFGILSKLTGITLMEGFLFSSLVFAGASQFIALNLLKIGAGFGEIVLTTLLVNLRHFLMSASIGTRLEKESNNWFPFIAFGITDEVFSVASFKEGKVSKGFMLALEFVSYLSWVGGTVLGYSLGGILPDIIKQSMGVALYAMFVAILMPEIKKSSKVCILACSSGLMNSILRYLLSVPQGWSIIISVICVSFMGIYVFEEKGVKINE